MLGNLRHVQQTKINFDNTGSSVGGYLEFVPGDGIVAVYGFLGLRDGSIAATNLSVSAYLNLDRRNAADDGWNALNQWPLHFSYANGLFQVQPVKFELPGLWKPSEHSYQNTGGGQEPGSDPLAGEPLGRRRVEHRLYTKLYEWTTDHYDDVSAWFGLWYA